MEGLESTGRFRSPIGGGRASTVTRSGANIAERRLGGLSRAADMSNLNRLSALRYARSHSTHSPSGASGRRKRWNRVSVGESGLRSGSSCSAFTRLCARLDRDRSENQLGGRRRRLGHRVRLWARLWARSLGRSGGLDPMPVIPSELFFLKLPQYRWTALVSIG